MKVEFWAGTSISVFLAKRQVGANLHDDGTEMTDFGFKNVFKKINKSVFKNNVLVLQVL